MDKNNINPIYLNEGFLDNIRHYIGGFIPSRNQIRRVNGMVDNAGWFNNLRDYLINKVQQNAAQNWDEDKAEGGLGQAIRGLFQPTRYLHGIDGNVLNSTMSQIRRNIDAYKGQGEYLEQLKAERTERDKALQQQRQDPTHDPNTQQAPAPQQTVQQQAPAQPAPAPKKVQKQDPTQDPNVPQQTVQPSPAPKKVQNPNVPQQPLKPVKKPPKEGILKRAPGVKVRRTPTRIALPQA